MTEQFANLAPYGWSPRWQALFSTAAEHREELTPGRVVRHDGVAVVVARAGDQRQWPVHATVDPQPVVGDWVVCSSDAVVGVLDRSSLLRRREPGRPVEQPLVANVDTVLVVCGLDRPVRPGRIRRAAATAFDAPAEPVVVLTKADGATNDDIAAAVETAIGSATAIDVVVTSAKTGRGIDDLRALAADRTIVLLGESGAGKSSLTNSLVGEDVALIGDVRAGDAKGRHTTTTREIHLLPGGGVLVDTPGVRALGLWTDPDAVAATFQDLEELATTCYFNDCRHQGEPGCAIALAIEAGEVTQDRLEAWMALRHEAEALARRSDAPAQRAHNKRFARVTKDAQRRKNRREPEIE